MELENKELDDLIESIGNWILEDEEKMSILNPVCFRQMVFTNAVMERLVRDTDIEISTTMHEPFKSMGSICLEGESMEFTDCKWLGRAIEFASNVEILPARDGRIRLTLTFHGLTTPIETK